MASLFSECFDGLDITCGVEDGAVVRLDFENTAPTVDAPAGDAALWERVRREMREYFAGERREFDIPLRVGGTEFQRLVWEGLRRIPYGRTMTYGELASAVGRPGGARAAGGACRRNPIAILIPCHRVLGADGALTGFGGREKIWVKERLLTLEGVRFKK